MRIKSTSLPPIFGLMVCIALVGCSRGISTTLVPTGLTATPTPQVPRVILVFPADMPQTQSDPYTTMVYNLAQENGMLFQVRNVLTVADIQMEPALKVIIALPPDPGLAGLTTAAPQVQFLAIGIPNLPTAANLSTIGASGSPVDQEAFLAGYIAAMLAEDYRVGIITQDSPNGLLAEKAFTNGMHFYCGLCQQAFAPMYSYPIHPEIKTDVPEGQYPPYADALHDYQAEVAYVYPPLATPELLDYMAQYDLKLIGESMPMQNLQPNWVVSLKPDVIPAIQHIFPDLVAGHGGQILPTPLFLADINPDLFSEGKQGLVQKILDDLQAGFIDTGVNP